MPRLRSRLTSKENIDNPAETKIRGTAKSRVVAAKKKGNDDKLIAVNALAILKSPVLRDRTNLTIKPTKVDVLKKGIEDEEADDEVTTKSQVKATRTRQKKVEEPKDVKVVSGRARTRGSKADVAETVSGKPLTSKDMSDMIVTDNKDDVPVKIVEKVTTQSKVNAEKKRPVARRTKLVEQKSESKVSTRAKKAGAVKGKVKPLQEDSGDKSEEENLSSNEADGDGLKDSVPENNDNEPQVAKKKSVKPSVTFNKRSLRTRKIKEVNKVKDVKAKLSNKTDNDQSEDSSPENADNEPEDVKKQSAIKKKVSVTSIKRSSRARKTKEVNKVKDVEEESSNEADKEESSPETDDLETKEADTPIGKKFFKTLVPTAHYKLSSTKKKWVDIKKKNVRGLKVRGKVADVRMSGSFRLRQTTIKESLANISKKALRARPPQKKSNENSSPSKKITKKRGPVYREILEDGNISKKNSPDKIYEFSYDLNDSQERKLIRKKKTTRRAPVKRNKAATKTKNAVSKKKKPTAVTMDTKLPEIIDTNQPVVPASIPEEPVENNQVAITVTAEVYDPPSPEPFFEDEPSTAVKELPKKPNQPSVISCQELSGENRINWTTTPVQPKPTEKESSGPRQFSQRPSKQLKTMLNTSLIRQSLSPISKANPTPYIEDSGSPWRLLVPSNSFSRVKNIFQSTPQGKKFTTLLGKASAVENKRLSSNMDKIEENNDENSNTKQNNSSENVQTNNSKSPRKFGTEISNIDNTIAINQTGISPSKSPRKFGTEISNIDNTIAINQAGISPSKSPRKFGTDLSNSNNSSPAKSPLKKKLSNSSSAKSPIKKKLSKSLVVDENRLISRGKTSVINASTISIQHASADEILDKENSVPNSQSPTKTSRKNSRSFGSSFGSPFKGFPSKKPVEDSVLGSPFKGFPNNKPVEDSIMGSPFKGFSSNKPVEDSIIGSPFKGFPSESPAAAVTEVGQELPSEIEPQPDIGSRPDIETQPDIEPQPAIELQPDIEPQPAIDPEPIIETHPEIEPQPDIGTQPDFEPQPGPSGLQKSSSPAKTWNLKQSNLNRFLNLPEKPTSTRISTAHGIFDDLNTSPIEVNINKNANKPEDADVENAFGFDDNDYNSDDANISYDYGHALVESLVPQEVTSMNVVKTKTVKAIIHNNNIEEGKKVTRISTGAINRALRSNKKDDEIEQAEKEVPPATVKFQFVEPSPILIEPVKFLDTFDLSTDVDTENINKPIGLFLDTEPVVHYKEPPRYSYKRKRRQRLMSCGDSEEESDDEERKRPVKKKKLSKAEREQNKKLEEWAKMINHSFAEVEHYDLLVE